MKHYDEDLDLICVEQIELAAKARSLVPFVGAGLSRLCGQPSWEGFADKTVEKITKRTPRLISYAQAELFAKLSTRGRLSLVDHIADANGMSRNELFGGIFDHSQTVDQYRKQAQQYGDIWMLAKSNLVITTNYDGLLGAANPPVHDATAAIEPVADGSPGAGARYQVQTVSGVDCNKDLILERASKEKLLIEWHGSARHANEMIVTVGDYIRHYAPSGTDRQRPTHLEFLTQLFRKKQVLFIGYGLEEMEILEYVMQKAELQRGPAQAAKSQPPHFLVQGYFQHEKALVDHLREYYRKSNILLLAFSRDESNYDGLLSMLADVASRVDAVATPTAEKLIRMKKLFEREGDGNAQD